MEIARDRRAGAKRIGELLVSAGVLKSEVLAEALQIAKKSSTPVGRVLLTIGALSERDLLAAIEVQALMRENLISAEFGVRALSATIKGKIPLDEAFRRMGYKPPEDREIVSTGELGELLINAGIITRAVLDDCMRQSEENNLPLGRCLVLARAVSQSLLTSALTAQVLVRDGKVKYEQAVQGLQAAFKKQQSIEKSLSDTGAYKMPDDKVKVGDLLSQAGLVSESDKVSAIEKGLVQQQPVGQVLVQQGIIAPTTLEETLKLQRMVNDGEINAIKAVELLRQANTRGISVEYVMQEKTTETRGIESINKVWYLIFKTEILSQAEIQRVETLAKDLKMSIGEVILSKDLVRSKMLEACSQAKKLIDDKFVTETHAIKLLNYCNKHGVSFNEALKTVPPDMESDDETEVEDEDKKGGLLGGIFGIFKRK